MDLRGGWRAAWLVLLVGSCRAEHPCDAPLHMSRHVRLAGHKHRLARLTSQFDNVRLQLDWDEEYGAEQDEWIMDVEFKTTSCLTSDEEPVSVFDSSDEEQLSTGEKPETGYIWYEDAGWLKLHARPLDWQDAQAVCETERGWLVVVNSESMVAALQDLLERNPRVLYTSVLTKQVLVGINDIEQEGVFKTSAGEEFQPWNETVWFPNEPDDGSPGEDCVAFHAFGRIRDVPCYFKLPFVCEKEFFP